MSAFIWLARDKTPASFVRVYKAEPPRRKYTRRNSWTGRLEQHDEYGSREVLRALCPRGVKRVLGLKIKPGQCVKIKVARA